MKHLFLVIGLLSLSLHSLSAQCGNCVDYVNNQLKARGYKAMPSGLFTYADYVSKLTPTQSTVALNSVGYSKAWNTKTQKWDHPTLGHVFIVNKVNSNGSLEVSEGNINGACRTSTITPSARGVVKYWKPTIQ